MSGKWKLAVLVLCLFVSQFAMADVGEGVVQRVIEWLTGPVGRGIAILGVIVIGFSMFFGRLDGARAAYFVAGIVLVFGGAELATMLIDEI